MNKAFIFDMDGVLINNEQAWHTAGKDFLHRLYGEDVLKQMGEIVGLSIDSEYTLATQYGFTMEKEAYYAVYDKQAATIYAQAKMTKHLEILIEYLQQVNFKIGIVSASRRPWIDIVLSRISSRNSFDYVLSIQERQDLHPKPHPDGYREAIKRLEASPQTTIILEDSNSGITAAKAAGAYTIGYKEHLIPGYVQSGADIYAASISEVIAIVRDTIVLGKE